MPKAITFRGLSLVVIIGLCLMPLGTAQATVYPDSMAAVGDSITRAFNTGTLPWKDAAQNSWSTGTTRSVNSLYFRLKARNPALTNHQYNFARSGAKMSDLLGQIASVNAQQVDYVTILMGANDVCASSEASMTSVATFHSQFLAALQSLNTHSPNTEIYVVSIPDVYHLWEILKDNSAARSKWNLFSICQSMLANPTSLAQADVDRRARVRQRNIDFNTQLALVCAQFTQCHFDGQAAFNTPFVTSDVSMHDYFHPSRAGQAKLAATAWGAAGFPP